MKEYHVSVSHGDDLYEGTVEKPFRTIQKAAETAEPGDTVIVHEGIYREWVRPLNGGRNESSRITYRAADGEKAVIKGSETIKGWERYSDNVWKKKLDNSFFPNGNPFSKIFGGDWFVSPNTFSLHTADIFLNGRSLYETDSLEGVVNPNVHEFSEHHTWSRKPVRIKDSYMTAYTWYAECDEKNTIIYVNFQDHDPNREEVEISVRPFCFFPENTGVNFITVDRFEICQCATQWAPPTAFQPGMIGPHWSKGWIIQNCDIHDSKAAGISLGRDASMGNNEASRYNRKSGYNCQMEVIFRALAKNWNRDSIGSHIIRNNRIHDCGQNGIVGHLGCIFSKIENNEIRDINSKCEFFGHEIAGIKLHAAIDVEIRNNIISGCTLGTWLDWENQGCRVSSNLYHDNDLDLFIEVCHGPYILDNNIFGSHYSLRNVSQGGAFIHNIFAGSVSRLECTNRYTPYHVPHSTAISGIGCVYSGDDRIMNNIFLGNEEIEIRNTVCGTSQYDEFAENMDAFIKKTSSDRRDVPKFIEIGQPVYLKGNMYLDGVKASPLESEAKESTTDSEFVINEKEGNIKVEITVPSDVMKTDDVLSTEELDTPVLSESCYEDRNGNFITFDQDINGKTRCSRTFPGPFADLAPGRNEMTISIGIKN